MKKLFALTSCLIIVLFCFGEKPITLNKLNENPEQYVGKTVSVQGLLAFKCSKDGNRAFINSEGSRFGLLNAKKEITLANFIKKNVVVTGKVRMLSSPTKPERCGKCDGKTCGQYKNQQNSNNSFSLYYIEVDSIVEAK